MKKVRYAIWLCLACCLFACLGCPVPALEPEPRADGAECASAEELLEALLADSGGVVTVSGDILWELEEDITVTRPVTVELGEYGIFVPAGRSMGISGPVRFTGSGQSRPLLEAEGDLVLRDGAAVSAEGEGSVGIRAQSLTAEFAEISASGAGAVAVELTDTEEAVLCCAKLSAFGGNSAAVKSAGPVTLSLCRVEGVVSVPAGAGIVLDGSAASPEIPGAAVVERVIFPANRLQENGLCVRAGAGQDELEELWRESLGNSAWLCAYDRAEQKIALTFGVSAEYAGVPAEASVPGTYEAVCTPRPPDWFPLELPAFSVPIHVVEENRPFLRDAQDAGAGAYVRFFSEIVGAERLVLRYSSDDGVTWGDAAELPGSVVQATGVQLENLETGRAYLFQLEVTGGPMAGRSNVLGFPFYGMYSVNNGGNRDYDDRNDMGEPPTGDFLVPPPEPSEPPESGSPEPAPSSPPVSSSGPAGKPGGSAVGEPSGENSALAVQGEPVSRPQSGGKAEESSRNEESHALPLWPFFLAAALLLAGAAGVMALRARRSGRHVRRRRGDRE